MSELSIIKKEVKKGIQITASDFFMICLGLCAGLNSSETLTGLLSFCVLGYFFQKSLQQFFEFLLVFLLSSGVQSGVLLYQNGLLVVFFLFAGAICQADSCQYVPLYAVSYFFSQFPACTCALF